MPDSVYIRPAVIAVLCILFGCSQSLTYHGESRRQSRQQTLELMEALTRTNASITGSRGISKISVKHGNRTDVARIAWQAYRPDKLRIEVLGIAGQREISIAVDGNWLYYLAHRSGEYHKNKVSDPSLKKMISVPIRSNEIVSILTGRLPIPDKYEVSAEKDSAGSRYIIYFENALGTVIEKIYMDMKTKQALKMERFNGFGNLRYRLELDEFRPVEGYRIPFLIRLSGDDGSNVNIRIHQFRADDSVPPMERFRIKPLAGMLTGRPV